MDIDQDTSLYTSTLSDCDDYNYCHECGNRTDAPISYPFCSEECENDYHDITQEQ